MFLLIRSFFSGQRFSLFSGNAQKVSCVNLVDHSNWQKNGHVLLRQRASKFYEFFLHLAPCVFLLTFDHQSPSHPRNVILSFQRHVKVHILHMIDPEEKTLDKQTLEDRFGKMDKYCTEL
jgi:hypothetical protein